jgi:hypothetical protein
MELDELKHTWQQNQSIKTSNTNIMELIQQKTYGPLEGLKKSFRKQVVLMLILPLYFIVLGNSDLHHLLNSIIFWFYIAFCVGVAIFSYQNYQIVSKMNRMDRLVKENLEQQIDLLEKRMKWKTSAVRAALLFFIVLLEIVPYFQQYSMSDKWHSLAPWIRYSSYLLLFLIHYFVSNFAGQRKYGRHLQYLKELVREMQ